MPTLQNSHDPQFLLLATNNDRTAWRPFGQPVVLVVPDRRDPLGTPTAHSGVWGVRVYVRDVPQQAIVVGHIDPDTGQPVRFPDRELYARSLTAQDLAGLAVTTTEYDVYRPGPSGPEPVAPADARPGDLLRIPTATGVVDWVPYLQSADYYDLSSVLLDLELLPDGRYELVYEAHYYTRQRAGRGTGELLCVDPASTAVARLVSPFNHPGEILSEFHRNTPAVYLTSELKSGDSTLGFYRPFTDALQDVFDEQSLLERVNWVRDCPSELIPYLSALLGWDLPYFPQSLDQLRRVMLRNTSRLQTMKGSRKVIVELFRLLGLEILISHLWWSTDGKLLIRPQQTLGGTYAAQEIRLRPRRQIEPVLAGWEQSGFGGITASLLHRPQRVDGLDDFAALSDGGVVTLDCYLVEQGSPAEQALLELVRGDMLPDPDGFAQRHPFLLVERDGYRHSAVTQAMAGLELGGYSQISIGDDPMRPRTVRQAEGWGRPPILSSGVRLDRATNRLELTFNGWLNFDGSDDLPPRRRRQSLWVVADYTRQQVDVPAALRDLRSNRFDLQILQAEIIPPLAGQRTYVNPETLDFAFEFLQKVKAFHSLLNVVRLTVELTETYEVTTTCVGGDIQQRHDTDMGRLQVPPAIIPIDPGDEGGCARYDPERLGYKRPDLLLRLRKLANLPEEHAAWARLDDRAVAEVYTVTGSRLGPTPPAPGRDACKFTHVGQDRLLPQARREGRTQEMHPSPAATAGTDQVLSPVHDLQRGGWDSTGAAASSNADSGGYGSFTVERPEILQPACELDGITDYCYKGRVDDHILYRPTLLQSELWRSRAGYLSLGSGVYWTYPAVVRQHLPGSPASYTGGGVSGTLGYMREQAQRALLGASYDRPLPPLNDSHLGRLYRALDTPRDESLHYNNRPEPTAVGQSFHLALERPELEIQHPNLHFPGCRFMILGALSEDYTHPDWRAKPWDDPHSRACGPCRLDPDWLDAQLVPDGDGDLVLRYRDAACTAPGNGLQPDIVGLADHSLPWDATVATPGPFDGLQPEDVVHAVWSQQADNGHPAITLENLCQPGTNADGFTPEGYWNTTRPVFNSEQVCTVELTGGAISYLDWCDGYGCSTGYLAHTADYDRGAAAFDAQPAVALFWLGDGILAGRGHRLSGGCILVDCTDLGGQQLPELFCSLELFRTQEGTYDWNPDQVWLSPRMLLQEQVGSGPPLLDGSVGSLFDLL